MWHCCQNKKKHHTAEKAIYGTSYNHKQPMLGWHTRPPFTSRDSYLSQNFPCRGTHKHYYIRIVAQDIVRVNLVFSISCCHSTMCISNFPFRYSLQLIWCGSSVCVASTWACRLHSSKYGHPRQPFAKVFNNQSISFSVPITFKRFTSSWFSF